MKQNRNVWCDGPLLPYKNVKGMTIKQAYRNMMIHYEKYILNEQLLHIAEMYKDVPAFYYKTFID